MTGKGIHSDPAIMVGKPVIKGTRVTVEAVLRLLGEGASPENVVEAFPNISVDDVRAAQLYAADVLSDWKHIAAE